MRIILVLLMACAMAHAADTISVFGRTWTVPDRSDWDVRNEGGTQVLVLKKARGPLPGPRRPIQFALTPQEYGNVTLEADVKPLGRSLMIVFAYKDAGHFDYAHLSIDTGVKQSHHNGIFHVFEGERVRISSVQGPPAFAATGRWYHAVLRHDERTGTVLVTVDGKPIPALRAVDLSLGAGKVGLGSFDETAEFKNVKITGSPVTRVIPLTHRDDAASARQVVTFPSGDRMLHGALYVPAGAGPFPAVVYNHGSFGNPAEVFDRLGPVFTAQRWVFFGPYRRGQGLSASAGEYIMDDIHRAARRGGIPAAEKEMLRLLTTDHLDDQMAALAWLRERTYVQRGHIAVMGNSFGGIETLLGAERGGYCAAVDSAGAAQSWARAPHLQELMTRAAANARAPVFFFQAANDYDLSPSRTLAAAMKRAGKTCEVKVYPAFGDSAADGHTFGYFGSAVWAQDVFGFLRRYC